MPNLSISSGPLRSVFAICLRVALILLSVGAPAAAFADPMAALTPQQRQIFESSPEDPVPKMLNGQAPGLEDRHYVVGNEWHLDLYQAKLANLGGGYMGVGSDQAYLLIGWMRPEIAWLTDYDDYVVQTHKIYHALFAQAATPKEFLALWQEANLDATVQVLKTRLAATPDKPEILKIYRKFRGRIEHRLLEINRRTSKSKIATFLSDQTQYDFIRNLILYNRVRAMRVNLLQDAGIAGIAKVARQLNVPVRAIYLSNAENYWKYPKSFKNNMKLLPFDDKSLIVRTVSTWGDNFDYAYNLQPALNFVAWLDKNWVTSYRDFVHWKRPEKDEFVLFSTAVNPEDEEVRRKHPAKPLKTKEKSPTEYVIPKRN